MSDYREVKCPNCGAPLRFNADSGYIKCDHCDSEFAVSELINDHAPEEKPKDFEWKDVHANFEKRQLQDMKVYECRSCGAIIQTDANTAATKCPYCDNNVVLTERVSGGLRPNYIIPFELDSRELADRMKDFCKGKPLLPKGFMDEKRVLEVQGIYIPFWLYSSNVEGEVNFRAVSVNTYVSGKYNVTETSTYRLMRDAAMDFENVPVDASVSFDDALMDSVEPYDYSKMVPFEEPYLAGFLADRYDSDPDKELPRAAGRMINSAQDAIASTATTYGLPSVESSSLRLTDIDVKYVFFPVYLINCEYNGKKYQYAVNGQTGKVVGDLPSSNSKLIGYTALGFFGVAAALFLLMSLVL